MATEENTSDKRQVYLLNQMVVQLDEMQKLLAVDKHRELGRVEGKLQQVVENFKTPSPMRDSFTMKSKIMAIDREIRNHFSPEEMQKSLK